MKARLLILVVLISLLLGMFAFPSESHASNKICHVVNRGENVSMIARRYGVTVAAIQQANNLWNPSLIYVGQCLWIPLSTAPPAAGCGQVHIVKRGEYLKVIAVRYGVSVTAIVQANGIRNPNLIYPGQRLTIPCTPAPPPQPKPPSSCTKTHVVQRGEYVKSIAGRYGVSWQSIVQINGLKNPNLIYPGQRLKIPVACPKPTPKPPTTPEPGTGPWTAKYWNNRWLSGNPKFTRQEEVIKHNWGTQGPGGGIGGTDFSARWTRDKFFDGGKYRFYVTVDDGVRVFVDGVKIIDQWHDTAPRTYSADRDLAAGNHQLQVDYYQNQGGAQVRLWVERIGDTGGVTGPWKGVYWNNTGLQGAAAVERYYQAINFNWGNKAPVTGVTADYFSARFTTEAQFDGGRYGFYATVDDGIRVWVDDNLIIDQWGLGSARTYIVDVDVSNGKHSVKVEYFENTGDAVCKVHWTKR